MELVPPGTRPSFQPLALRGHQSAPACLPCSSRPCRRPLLGFAPFSLIPPVRSGCLGLGLRSGLLIASAVKGPPGLC